MKSKPVKVWVVWRWWGGQWRVSSTHAGVTLKDLRLLYDGTPCKFTSGTVMPPEERGR